MRINNERQSGAMWFLHCSCICGLIILCLVTGCTQLNADPPAGDRESAQSKSMVMIPVSQASQTVYANNMQKGSVPPGVYQGLVIKHTKGDFLPSLAESWTVSEDASVWTFNLVKDATWNDGTPFTCRDVRFTRDYLTANNLTLAYVLHDVESIGCPDDSTAVFTLKTSYSGFLDQISRTPGITISPEHVWSTIDDPQHYQDTEFIGTGPFVFEKSAAGYVQMKRNDRYYGKKPQIDGFILTVISNPDSQILALKNGEIDVVSDISPAVAQSLKGEPNIAMYTINDSSAFEIGFNMKRYPTSIPAFRKAMSHAIDRDTISPIIGSGRPTETTFLVPSLAGEYVNPDVVGMYDYNMDKARQILQEGGFTWNSKGNLIGPDGTPVTITIPLGTKGQALSANPKIVSVLKNDWGALGIPVTTVSYEDQSQYRKAVGENPVFIDSFPVTLHDDADALTNFAVTPTQETNYYNYDNPEYNALVKSIRDTADREEILRLAYRMQEILARDIPSVPVCTSDTIVAYRSDRFTGWDLGLGYYSVTDSRVLSNLTPVR